MDNLEYSPLDTFKNALNKWWFIVGLILAGGMIGILFHSFRQPIYETKAVFTIHIDFTQTGVLSEFEQDYAINTARHLMSSNSVIDRVAAEILQRDIPLESAVVGKNVFIERKQPIIEIRVRSSDPNAAAEIANIWAAQAFIELQEAHSHALLAESLRSYITALESCENQDGNPQQTGICVNHTFDEIYLELEAVNQMILDEVQKSRGVIPALVFDLLQEASVPRDPVAFGRNSLALSGALAGFFAGIFLSSLRFKRK
jgi:hypothetical protein